MRILKRLVDEHRELPTEKLQDLHLQVQRTADKKFVSDRREIEENVPSLRISSLCGVKY